MDQIMCNSVPPSSTADQNLTPQQIWGFLSHIGVRERMSTEEVIRRIGDMEQRDSNRLRETTAKEKKAKVKEANPVALPNSGRELVRQIVFGCSNGAYRKVWSLMCLVVLPLTVTLALVLLGIGAESVPRDYVLMACIMTSVIRCYLSLFDDPCLSVFHVSCVGELAFALFKIVSGAFYWYICRIVR
ncbi:hypothetical protein Ancab_007637 [Ancistrocladus abbreviatus]